MASLLQNKSSRVGFENQGLSRCVFAQDTTSGFKKANQLYREGKYSDAAHGYESVLKQKSASEVYYNLGNTYFRLKKIGMAILNYERALLLAPRDQDISTNFKYAKSAIEFEIKDKRSWYVKAVSSLLQRFTTRVLWLVTLCSIFVFLLFLNIRIFIRKKPILDTFQIILLCVSLQ